MMKVMLKEHGDGSDKNWPITPSLCEVFSCLFNTLPKSLADQAIDQKDVITGFGNFLSDTPANADFAPFHKPIRTLLAQFVASHPSAANKNLCALYAPGVLDKVVCFRARAYALTHIPSTQTRTHITQKHTYTLTHTHLHTLART